MIALFPPCFSQFIPFLIFALHTGKHTSVYAHISCEKTSAQLILLPTTTLKRSKKDQLFIYLHIYMTYINIYMYEIAENS